MEIAASVASEIRFDLLVRLQCGGHGFKRSFPKIMADFGIAVNCSLIKLSKKNALPFKSPCPGDRRSRNRSCQTNCSYSFLKGNKSSAPLTVTNLVNIILRSDVILTLNKLDEILNPQTKLKNKSDIIIKFEEKLSKLQKIQLRVNSVISQGNRTLKSCGNA